MPAMTQTGLRMFREGRLVEYRTAKARLLEEGIRGPAFRAAIDREYPPLEEAEIRARQAAGVAPSDEEVSDLGGRAGLDRARLKAATSEKHGAVLELFPASKFRKGLGMGVIEEIEWVKDHLAVADVKPEDAPSAGVFAMWQVYSRSAAERQKFFQTVLPRALPALKDEKQRQRFKDDERKLDDLADGVGKMAGAAVEEAQEQWRRRGAGFVLEGSA